MQLLKWIIRLIILFCFTQSIFAQNSNWVFNQKKLKGQCDFFPDLVQKPELKLTDKKCDKWIKNFNVKNFNQYYSSLKSERTLTSTEKDSLPLTTEYGADDFGANPRFYIDATLNGKKYELVIFDIGVVFIGDKLTGKIIDKKVCMNSTCKKLFKSTWPEAQVLLYKANDQ